jgi:CBS domain-containing protein
VAGFLRPLAIGAGPLFALQTAPAAPVALLSCLVAGIACGALAWCMSTLLYRVEDAFHRLPIHWMWWPALGGLAVGIGGWFQPRALGVGYDVIGDLLHNRLALGALALLLAVKLVIWLIALGSGTSGGVLAPLLMLGAGLGAALAPWLPGAEPGLWPLVFMAATLGGMMRAPVMAVVFAFELTGDANALLPLLAAASVAYGFTVLTMGRSILTEKIARRGHHIYREYGIDPLERHSVAEVMSAHPVAIDAGLDAAAAMAAYFGAAQAHRAYPVTKDGLLLGMADRAAMARLAPDAAVGTLFENGTAPAVALAGETCRAVAARLANLGLERLPVVAAIGEPRLLGIVSRSDLIKATAKLHDEEHDRRALRTLPLRRRIVAGSSSMQRGNHVR